ncbi:hypothetical protein DM02DRAFT_536896 [Periconia macrospinosa]|uniref:Gfd2/YDR514C-like C-terminal domain-containing protein n=1 Tax=Periconia macrospinosa TaxID=97972 RepID=A0A2V1DEV3_9PLEO|nr:hypothetical protein DM02DRAFT_536896 [Periconia macrospinosa]
MSKQELTTLRADLRSVPHRQALHQYLRGEGTSNPSLLQNAVFVSIRRCWSPHPPYNLMEIGLAIYNGKQQQQQPAGPHGENVLKDVRFLHLRFREQASGQLPNGADPTKFHFGTTAFVDSKEARSLLSQIWYQPMDESNPAAGFRPVICLMAANDKPTTPTDNVNFNPAAIGTTVAVLDPEIVAVQSAVASFPCLPVDKILEQHFSITANHPDNTGNQAAYLMIMVVLAALRHELYHDPQLNIRDIPGQYGQSSSKPAQDVVNYLMDHESPEPPVGTIVYCPRCASSDHLVMDCPETFVLCSKCRYAYDQTWRIPNAITHKDEACSYDY